MRFLRMACLTRRLPSQATRCPIPGSTTQSGRVCRGGRSKSWTFLRWRAWRGTCFVNYKAILKCHSFVLVIVNYIRNGQQNKGETVRVVVLMRAVWSCPHSAYFINIIIKWVNPWNSSSATPNNTLFRITPPEETPSLHSPNLADQSISHNESTCFKAIYAC